MSRPLARCWPGALLTEHGVQLKTSGHEKLLDIYMRNCKKIPP